LRPEGSGKQNYDETNHDRFHVSLLGMIRNRLQYRPASAHPAVTYVTRSEFRSDLRRAAIIKN
jgi:hypothetical protein